MQLNIHLKLTKFDYLFLKYLKQWREQLERKATITVGNFKVVDRKEGRVIAMARRTRKVKRRK